MNLNWENWIVRWSAITGGIGVMGGAVIWAFTSTADIVKPLVVDKGSLPAASADEFKKDQVEVASAISALTVQVQATQAHQTDQDLLLNESRKRAVLSDLAQTEDLIARNPKSSFLKDLKDHDEDDLKALAKEHDDLVRAQQQARQRTYRQRK